MTRLSRYFLPTLKDAPADSEAVSHQLMVRAGLIRQLGAGLWTYLPAGWRVQRRIEAIIREEMDAIGAQEVLMPVLQPRELWQKTGRDTIDELFTLEDRKGAPMVLAMTHEEAVTHHVAREIRSYRDLPLTLYHFQVKERDEPRPRAGVLRTREFIMKDSYSFDRDQAGLDAAYAAHTVAYERIFDRCGLEWYRVESDVGMMGGSGAHEYMAPCEAGENEIVLADGYAANLEVASAVASGREPGPIADGPVEVSTPGISTVAEVSSQLSVAPSTLIKAMPLIGDDGKPLLALVRGDHRLNEIKLANSAGRTFQHATEQEIADRFGSAVGFTGPVGCDVPIIIDGAISGGGWVAGSNRLDLHLTGVEVGRDFVAESADIRSVAAGDLTTDGQSVRIVPAIEVGNIFKLGTRYSDALGAKYLDENSAEQSVVMGSYGIGPARIAAAAIEQGADELGIVWPKAIAPFDVHLITLGKEGSDEFAAAESIYGALGNSGLSVIFDDRDAGAGAKFADAELLGCPLRLTVGRKSLEAGNVEAHVRRGMEQHSLPIANIAAEVSKLWATLS